MPNRGFELFPQQASTGAASVDHLFLFLLAIVLFFSTLIFALVFVFAIKYRRRSEDERPRAIEGSIPLELLWTGIPIFIVVFIFVWGSVVFVRQYRVPGGAMEISVVGKQWMWKLQHPEGQREINTLHVPTGRPIKLLMTSEDVIHSFFVPAFRMKQDVVPGRYTVTWFQATKPGEYHLFCAEYCGTQHSGMIGSVIAMEPLDFERWIAGGGGGVSMASAGERLFQTLGCNTCHRLDGKGRGPSLAGIFGRPVSLESGSSVVADEDYIRESILNPKAKTVAGYPPIMPTFEGQISEEGVLQIMAYIKSLASEERQRTTQQ